MGEVVTFPIERVTRKLGTTKKRNVRAEVLVFEGVRYSSSDKTNETERVQPVVEPVN